jgi:uncharacterized OB-fold protein
VNASAQFQRPVPRPDPLASGFWQAAAKGQLAIQRCTACRVYQHPPRPLCRACGGADLQFKPVSGNARLTSWTITHHEVLAGFAPVIPYTVMVVELIEQDGLYLLSDLVGREQLRSTLRVGMPMRVTFETQAEGPSFPQFVPMEGAS